MRLSFLLIKTHPRSRNGSHGPDTHRTQPEHHPTAPCCVVPPLALTRTPMHAFILQRKRFFLFEGRRARTHLAFASRWFRPRGHALLPGVSAGIDRDILHLPCGRDAPAIWRLLLRHAGLQGRRLPNVRNVPNEEGPPRGCDGSMPNRYELAHCPGPNMCKHLFLQHESGTDNEPH